MVLLPRYKVARASEYLAITGLGITDVKVAKKAWVLPGRTCTVFDICAVNYSFDITATSSDNLELRLRVVCTIGPITKGVEKLKRYVKLISLHEESNQVRDLVKGVIEGSTRVQAASKTMENIVTGTTGIRVDVEELAPANPAASAPTKGLITKWVEKLKRYVKSPITKDGEAASKTKDEIVEGTKDPVVQEASKTKDEIVEGTKAPTPDVVGFREEVFRQVQGQLDKFGMVMYSANLMPPVDIEKSRQAEFKAQKADAENQAELQFVHDHHKSEDRRTQKLADQNIEAEADCNVKKEKAEGLKKMAEAEKTYLENLLAALGQNHNTLKDYLLIDRGMYKGRDSVLSPPNVSISGNGVGAFGDAALRNVSWAPQANVAGGSWVPGKSARGVQADACGGGNDERREGATSAGGGITTEEVEQEGPPVQNGGGGNTSGSEGEIGGVAGAEGGNTSGSEGETEGPEVQKEAIHQDHQEVKHAGRGVTKGEAAGAEAPPLRPSTE